MSTIRRGSIEESFDAQEWICVRYAYVTSGHTGPGAVLITGGEMNADGVTQTRSLLERARGPRLDTRLSWSMQHGTGRAPQLFFDLIKKTWKLHYVRAYDSGEVVFLGTKRVGTLADVPRLRDVPVYMSALTKLGRLFDGDVEGPTRVTL